METGSAGSFCLLRVSLRSMGIKVDSKIQFQLTTYLQNPSRRNECISIFFFKKEEIALAFVSLQAIINSPRFCAIINANPVSL